MIFLVAITIIVGLIVFWRNQYDARGSETYSSVAIMAVTGRGGLCPEGACEYDVHNIFDNGEFEGYKKLSQQEVSKLEDIIDSTDFLQYSPASSPDCSSYYDGSDRIILFPKKYGNRRFIICEMSIPEEDPAFSYINGLIKSHYKE